MNIVAIVQARMGSTRLPGKVLLPICDTPMIELLLERLRQSKKIHQIILATSTDSNNAPLVSHANSLGIKVFQGHETDVLDRYYQAAKLHEADIVVRITGDCPLIDTVIVDNIIDDYLQSNVDYASNTCTPTFPDGLDTEVFSINALGQAWIEATLSHDREHVTPYIKNSGKFQVKNIKHDQDYSSERWTVDEPEDFQVIKAIFEKFAPQKNFTWLDVLSLKNTHPEIFEQNKHLIRNEGATLGTGQKLWKRAKRVIPGGNMLLSKRAEMFLPEQWPAYFSKAKGCQVWDLDGNKYIDMSLMAIGTNILGYGHPEVDAAVQNIIMCGNMSTFNCPEEVYLAERLVELHPWADMARFARSGGEANAIGIRIARAASGRDKVAICGYHGWHDWYLAANLAGEQSLESHLLKGLQPKGVPKSLKDTTIPFNYNQFEELETIVREHDIGVIKMEVMRNFEPQDDFLHKVRKLATEKNIVLIFDECTSGFRQSLGGLHKYYGVEPDMAIFGKALGNGYSITAVIGKREVMEHAQSTFISSTFWTERIGPAAALKTLEIMERIKSYDLITHTGKLVANYWDQLATKYSLPISIFGLPAMINFAIKSDNALAYKTLITQEMLKKGFLATTSLYVCIEHTKELIEQYIDALDPIFKLIKECEEGRPILDMLEVQVCDSGFRRLN